MELLMRAVLFGMPDSGPFRDDPQAHPPDRERGQATQAPKPGLANGAPLSLRIRCGRPYSANARAKRCWVAARVRLSSPSQRNTKRLNPSRKVNG
jgi:hypothetical protein